MKTMKERKILWIGLTLDELMKILERHGYLDISVYPALFPTVVFGEVTHLTVPDDAVIVASALTGPENAGAAQLRIGVESPELDKFDALEFCGHAMIWRLTDPPRTP